MEQEAFCNQTRAIAGAEVWRFCRELAKAKSIGKRGRELQSHLNDFSVIVFA